MRLVTSLFLAAGVAFAAAPALADPVKLKLDRSHIYVGFQVGHIGFSTVHGRFNDAAGEITFDKDKPETSTVSATIQTKSVDTNDEARDKHLRTADFFDAEKFPTMTFKSTKIEKTGEATGRMTGELTVLGVTKPVTLDVTFTRMAEHPFPAYKKVLTAGFSARGKIKRSDFGMTKFVPAVGDEIVLLIDVEAVRCEGEAAESPSCKT
ncbi:YceI family protein [Vineibacter terrae]|uniref:YceI family protein n=1 Tax=Vineibacter terrae TaxID=2586908 RepID=UPI002E336342|nr:YceI family protein [Vineibacter terrae]HEX2890875.1 YceI family protein [Vineibacter terrae]